MLENTPLRVTLAGRSLMNAHDAELVAVTMTREHASTIALAVNSHSALMAALKPFADLGVGSGPGEGTETYRITREAIRNARAALDAAKLEG